MLSWLPGGEVARQPRSSACDARSRLGNAPHAGWAGHAVGCSQRLFAAQQGTRGLAHLQCTRCQSHGGGRRPAAVRKPVATHALAVRQLRSALGQGPHRYRGCEEWYAATTLQPALQSAAIPARPLVHVGHDYMGLPNSSSVSKVLANRTELHCRCTAARSGKAMPGSDRTRAALTAIQRANL